MVEKTVWRAWVSQGAASLFLLGFLGTVAGASRDARAGHRVRVWNATPLSVEVYAVGQRGGHVETCNLGIVTPNVYSDWWEIPGASREIVIAPRNAAQRIARLDIGSDAVQRLGNKDVPLVICLQKTEITVYDGATLGDCPRPRYGWNLPLLYLAGMGWCGIFWFRRHSHRETL